MYQSKPREIKRLGESTMTRMMAMSMVSLFLVTVVLSRFGVMDFFGPTMASCIASACVASLVVMSSRTSYLPFLGETVFPSTLLREPTQPADATVVVDVQVDEGATHVAYWASEPGARAKNPWVAYKGYENSGIAAVEKGGAATLHLRCPSSYAIKGKVLPPHVHYRAVFPGGVMGEIKTAKVVCA